MIEILPQYGYWKDLLEICLIICEMKKPIEYNKIITKTADLFSNQIKKDYNYVKEWSLENIDDYLGSNMNDQQLSKAICDNIDKNKCYLSGLSLAGKWAPRENTKYSNKIKIDSQKIYRIILKKFDKNPKEYRRICAFLNDILGVVESKMCQNKFSAIKFSGFGSCTSNAVKKYKKAFLNLHKNKDNDDRRGCALNFKNAITEGKIAGKVCDISSLVKEALDHRNSNLEDVINAQFDKKKNEIIKNIEEEKKDLTEKGINLINSNRIVITCDVSGSMNSHNSLPLHAAIALSIITSNICDKKFKDHILTFHETPSWCILDKDSTFCEKVKKIATMPWGGSTNFEASCNLIIDMIKEYRLKEEDIPTSWMILSDMQIDEACSNGYYNKSNSYDIIYSKIEKAFEEFGKEVYGHPIKPPLIIFWNLNPNTKGMPVSRNQHGAISVSGYSPSLLIKILSGDLESVEKKDTGVTPEEQMMKYLDDKKYDPIRDICFRNSKEIIEKFI